MNFEIFNAGATNLFPAANTTGGGQLCTEFNLRSLHSVDTNPEIKYFLGHSFVHSQDDFAISHRKEDGDSVLTIAPGTGIINGHYVQSLTPIKVDIAEGNYRMVQTYGENAFVSGELDVGLRMVYMENTTLDGRVNQEGMYVGVQVIVLPPDQFILPGRGQDITSGRDSSKTEASKTDPDSVTAHIKLGSFKYDGSGVIVDQSIQQYQEKTRYFDINRVLNLENSLSGDYFSRSGLRPNELYAVGGKWVGNLSTAEDEEEAGGHWSGEWCLATDSLMIWDGNPRMISELTTGSGNSKEPDETEQERYRALMRQHRSASFIRVGDRGEDGVTLLIPHKQVDNDSVSGNSDTDYIPVCLDLPIAGLLDNKAGIVDRNFIKSFHNVITMVSNFAHMPNGKQIAFKNELTKREDLGPIPTGASIGDYIFVRMDHTLEDEGVVIDEVTVSLPATIYAVLPARVASVTYVSTKPSGYEIAEIYSREEPNTTESAKYNEIFGFNGTEYRGVVGKDYFTIKYGDEKDPKFAYYRVASVTGGYVWSDPVIVTDTIPMAQEDRIGGFLNLPDESKYSDAGYVYLDDEGHLRMMDYELLRQGTLAYQLGTDQEFTGMSIEELQESLDEFVNERIAFPNRKTSIDESNMIEVTIELPNEGSVTDGDLKYLEIRGIDSRFNTCVYFHLQGDATSAVHVRFIDCEKIMIDSNISGSPTLELYRSGIWYDPVILNQMQTIEDMSLWYERFEDDDPDIVVDGLTVKEQNIVLKTEDTDYFSMDDKDDIHYEYALESVTFNPSGDVVGIGLFVKDSTSRINTPTGRVVITADFSLPQGTRVAYPITKFTKSLKVTGHFVSAYQPTNSASQEVIVSNISFSAVTEPYTKMDMAMGAQVSGTITFFDDSFTVDGIKGNGVYVEDTLKFIPGIGTDEFHIFRGGVLG